VVSSTGQSVSLLEVDMPTLLERLMPLGKIPLLERPARGKTPAQFRVDLEKSAPKIVQRMAKAPQTPRNHSVITHIIGIEKWCQRRIRVALGEPFVDEEYNVYRPLRETTWADLIPLFEATRKETIMLVNQLTPVMLKERVFHNGYGNITIGGWLRYVDMHSALESRKLR
jgi:hypothetical protein